MARLHATHRAILGLSAVLGLGAMLIAGAVVATAEDVVAPTVTFTATGVPPLHCGSRPNVSSLTVSEGTPILLENQIGETAWVRVDQEAVMEVADGGGALLTLTLGQHDVRLVPGCLIGGGTAKSVAVTVTPAPATGASTTEEPTPSAGPDGGPTNAPAPFPPGAVSQPTGTAGPAGSPAVLPVASEAALDPIATHEPARSAVIDASAVQLRDAGTSKGVRLLGIIAAICVLGVTAAIIRSIVRLSP